MYLGESTTKKKEHATFKVKREMGSNRNQTITWKVHPMDTYDIKPSFGKLRFNHNQIEVNYLL